MQSLFISDLHLHPAHPDGMALFGQFANEHASQADRLFILGDLFEYWLGDDAIDFSGYRPVVNTLARMAVNGTQVLFVHGNRDFLVGEGFASAVHGRLLPDPSVFDLDGRRVLLSHGDLLCTDDVEHQAFRAQTRNPEWQASLLSQSLQQRDALARQLRMGSEQGKQIKAEAIMDVTTDAVEQQMRKHAVRVLIHGHTHRPAIHELEIDGSLAWRIVLQDWYEARGGFLSHADGQFRMIDYPSNELTAEIRPEA